MRINLEFSFTVMDKIEHNFISSLGISPHDLAIQTTNKCFLEADKNNDDNLDEDEFVNWFISSEINYKINIDELRSGVFNNINIHDLITLFTNNAIDLYINKEQYYSLMNKIYTDSNSKMSIDDYNNFINTLYTIFTSYSGVNILKLVAGLSVFCQGTSNDKIKEIFDFFDKDNNGVLSFDELYTFLYSIYRVLYYTDLYQNEKLSPYHLAYATAKQCFLNCNKTKDIPLSFEEFFNWYTSNSNYEKIIDNKTPITEEVIQEAEKMYEEKPSSPLIKRRLSLNMNDIFTRQSSSSSISTLERTLSRGSTFGLESQTSPTHRGSVDLNADPHSIPSIVSVVKQASLIEFNREDWSYLMLILNYDKIIGDYIFNLFKKNSEYDEKNEIIDIRDINPILIIFSSSSKVVKIQSIYNYCYCIGYDIEINVSRIITKDNNDDNISKSDITKFITPVIKLISLITKNKTSLEDQVDNTMVTLPSDIVSFTEFSDWINSLNICHYELTTLFSSSVPKFNLIISPALNSPFVSDRKRSSSISLSDNEAMTENIEFQPATAWVNVWSITSMLKLNQFTCKDIIHLLRDAANNNMFITEDQYKNIFIPSVYNIKQGNRITNKRVLKIYNDIYDIANENNNKKVDIFLIFYCISVFFESETPDINEGKLLYRLITYNTGGDDVTYDSLKIYIKMVINLLFYINTGLEGKLKISKQGVIHRVTKWLVYQGDTDYSGSLTRPEFLSLYTHNVIHLRIAESISTEMCYSEIPNLQLLLQLSQIVFTNIIHINMIFKKAPRELTLEDFLKYMERFIKYYKPCNPTSIFQCKLSCSYMFKLLSNGDTTISRKKLLNCLAFLCQHSPGDIVNFMFHQYHIRDNTISYDKVYDFLLPFTTLIYNIEPILYSDNLYTDNTPSEFSKYILDNMCDVYGVNDKDSISKQIIVSYLKSHNLFEIILYKHTDIISCKNIYYHINIGIKSIGSSYNQLGNLFNKIETYKRDNKIPFKTLLYCYELFIQDDLSFPIIATLSKFYNYMANNNYFYLDVVELYIIFLLISKDTCINKIISIFKLMDVDNDNVICIQDLKYILKIVYNFIFHFIIIENDISSIDYRISDVITSYTSNINKDYITLREFINDILDSDIEIKNLNVSLKSMFHIQNNDINQKILVYDYYNHLFIYSNCYSELFGLFSPKHLHEKKIISISELKNKTKLYNISIDTIYKELLKNSKDNKISEYCIDNIIKSILTNIDQTQYDEISKLFLLFSSKKQIDIYELCYGINLLCKPSSYIPFLLSKNNKIQIKYLENYYNSINSLLNYIGKEIDFNDTLLNDIKKYTNKNEEFTQFEFCTWLLNKEDIINKSIDIINIFFGISKKNYSDICDIFEDNFGSLDKNITIDEFNVICQLLYTLYINGKTSKTDILDLSKSIYTYISIHHNNSMNPKNIIDDCIKLNESLNPKFIYYLIDKNNKNTIYFNDIKQFIELLLSIETYYNNGFTTTYFSQYDISLIITEGIYKKLNKELSESININEFIWYTTMFN